MKRSWFPIFVLISCAFPPKALAQATELTSATVLELNRAFDAGTLTSEKLVSLYLARVAAYDDAGPMLNAVIVLNPKSAEIARARDRERREKGPRSPFHGIPVVLKDNIDTTALPTTAGSALLEGSIPPDDAFLVQKLEAAGAIVLAKVNMSELASGGAVSSLGGATRNPHDLARTPSGSSGGTGAAIAAAFAQAGLGTDTGGSVRGPSTANGIVGLKPTHGLLSRDGIVPLALSFDMAGPMARSVYDVAALLGVLTGVDPADEATKKSEGRFETDYTKFLDAAALRGARIGIARDFLGQDSEVDWVVEASLQSMKNAGAEVVDVSFPKWLLDANGALYTTIRHREFRAQIEAYLNTLQPGFPKTLAELITKSQVMVAPDDDGEQPNPGRWSLMQREEKSGKLTDAEYLAVRDYGLPLVREIVEGLMASENLDAIVYPTSPRRPPRADDEPDPSITAGPPNPIRFANLTGFPDLVVPAGFTSRGLPVGISFLGKAFNEPRLLALGYSFEQATRARRTPVHTPARPGETIGK
jgi:amidase